MIPNVHSTSRGLSIEKLVERCISTGKKKVVVAKETPFSKLPKHAFEQAR